MVIHIQKNKDLDAEIRLYGNIILTIIIAETYICDNNTELGTKKPKMIMLIEKLIVRQALS